MRRRVLLAMVGMLFAALAVGVAGCQPSKTDCPNFGNVAPTTPAPSPTKTVCYTFNG